MFCLFSRLARSMGRDAPRNAQRPQLEIKWNLCENKCFTSFPKTPSLVYHHTLTFLQCRYVCCLLGSLGGFLTSNYPSHQRVPTTKRAGSRRSTRNIGSTIRRRPLSHGSPPFTRTTLPFGHRPPRRSSSKPRTVTPRSRLPEL